MRPVQIVRLSAFRSHNQNSLRSSTGVCRSPQAKKQASSKARASKKSKQEQQARTSKSTQQANKQSVLVASSSAYNAVSMEGRLGRLPEGAGQGGRGDGGGYEARRDRTIREHIASRHLPVAESRMRGSAGGVRRSSIRPSPTPTTTSRVRRHSTSGGTHSKTCHDEILWRRRLV